MSATIQPLYEITNRAERILVKELRVADTLRYLGQFRSENGDYTVERERLFKGESVKSIIADIKNQRNKNEIT
ncbi:hypothetical protein [Candidatus Electronema sp. JM]|uniref:hypothetical protein n=1 Tax=Candidatus Electronema sp. JM TaxID=3401571 RepID=UPI003AA97EA0